MTIIGAINRTQGIGRSDWGSGLALYARVIVADVDLVWSTQDSFIKLEDLGLCVESSTLLINHYEVHPMLILALMFVSFAFGGSATMLADPKASLATVLAAGGSTSLATLFTIVYVIKLSGGA